MTVFTKASAQETIAEIKIKTSATCSMCKETIEKNLAIGNGILTVENEEQAWERASITKGNKGGHAARACIELINIKKKFVK